MMQPHSDLDQAALESELIKQGMMTREQTVAWLKLSKMSLYRLAQSGQLIPVYVGSKLLYDPVDVLDFVRRLKEERQEEPAQILMEASEAGSIQETAWSLAKIAEGRRAIAKAMRELSREELIEILDYNCTSKSMPLWQTVAKSKCP